MDTVQTTTSVVVAKGRCPRCGASLGGFGPEGLCGACLFDSALGEEPSTEPAETPGPSPRRLGDYELLGEIARGGMGIVFRARQISLNRIVALKMILRGEFADPASLSRFRQEAEAAAHLKHPNIVAIHEVGESDGQHYFSMDYIEGRNLSALVRDGPLPAPQAAHHLEKIARAVHYAHEQGVLHRDLKPSNVLLDASNQPHVTDFGLAKRVESVGEMRVASSDDAPRKDSTQDSLNSLTLSGQVLGTPSFMSPEQAASRRGQVGPRSDVYSLGAILYHLLTGRPPFVGAEIHVVLEQVVNAEVVTPLLLNPDVPPDLETIVLKCLEKDPARRYETALDLAEDIARQLRHEPILAVRPSAAYRARKFVRRHRLGVAVAAGVTVLLTAATLISTTFAFKATRQSSRAEYAEGQAQAKAREAQLNAEEAKTQAAETEAVLGFFRDNVLAAARPQGRAGGLGYDVTVRRAVESAEFRVSVLFTNRPKIEARIRLSLGETYDHLGEYTNAIRQFQRVRALSEEAWGPSHKITVSAMGSLGMAYRRAGQVTNAIALLEETLALCRATWGSNATETLDAMNDLGSAYSAHGPDNRLYAALPLYEEALRISRTIDPGGRRTMSYANNLANVLLKFRRAKEAVPLFEEVKRYQEAKDDPEKPGETTHLNNLALAYQLVGQWERALLLYERVLMIEEKRLPKGHPYLLQIMNNQGLAYGKAGRFGDAVELLEKTVELSKTHMGLGRVQTLETMNNLAAAYEDANRWSDTVPLQEYLLTRLKEMSGPDQPDTVRAMDNLARAYFKAGRSADALSMLTNALPDLRTKRGPDYQGTLLAMNVLARHYLYCNQVADADQLLQKWIPRLDRWHRDRSTRFTAHALLGWALLGKGKHDEAEGHLIQGYDGLTQLPDEQSSRTRPELIQGTARRLVHLYDAWDQPEMADWWSERLK